MPASSTTANPEYLSSCTFPFFTIFLKHREAADISGIQYVTDADKQEVEEILKQ